MVLVSIWIAAALALIAIGVVWRAGGSRKARGAVVITMVAGTAVFGRPFSTRAEERVRGPRVDHGADWVGSGACVGCHPSEHASWSRTYHRTMTERAAAPYAITTGSHHMKGFWTEDESGGLHMMPFVYARDEGKLIARADAFLEPANAEQHDVRWNSNCIACHSTGGRPRIGGAARAPEVAELGIACEACHGPGAEHAAVERNPFTRWARGSRDLHIVNPAKLSPERASAVCGACHAYAFPKSETDFLANGYANSFHPGDALEPSRTLLTPSVLASGAVSLDTDVRNLFWPDGTVRVGGREYNAMILSACYLRGEGERKITCMTCHSMHDSDPDDQLRRDRTVQNACISCHKMPTNHSKHREGSVGSLCVSCHMPKTSYALRYAIRSHRIDSPDPSNPKPNACDLCHLDRKAAVGLLSADAAERVIWADAFGDPDARAASGSDWEKPVIEAAERDPYAVIRFIAKRSAAAYPDPTRTVVSASDIEALVSKRDDRDVYVAE